MEGQNSDYRNYIGQTGDDYDIQKFRQVFGDEMHEQKYLPLNVIQDFSYDFAVNNQEKQEQVMSNDQQDEFVLSRYGIEGNQDEKFNDVRSYKVENFGGDDISSIMNLNKTVVNSEVSGIASYLRNDGSIIPSNQNLNSLRMKALGINQAKPIAKQALKRENKIIKDMILKSETTAKQDAIEEMERSEKEALKGMFNIDGIEFDQIIFDWDQRRGQQLRLEDVILDLDHLLIADKTQKKLIDEFQCSICLGLVRLPGIMCGSGNCNKIFCEVCLQDCKDSYLKNQTQVSMMDSDAFMHSISLQKLNAFPCPMCKQPFLELSLQRQLVNQIKELVFKSCQNCSDEQPDQNFKYDDYITHLIRDCPKIQLECPFNCGESERYQNFQIKNIKKHLYDQLCPNYHVYCKDCGQKCLVKDRFTHLCALGKLYEQIRNKIIQLKICSQICKGCRKETTGVKVHPGGSLKAMLFSEKNCYDCCKEQMQKLFEKWESQIQEYFRDTYKGKIISPWHYYKLQIIENDMMEIDKNIFDEQYSKLMQGLKQIKTKQ